MNRDREAIESHGGGDGTTESGTSGISAGLAGATRLFNAGRYLEAHEAFEELWHGTHGELADLYKGLIQAAIALHHFQDGNLAGARKLYSGHRRYLATYVPESAGLDIAAFLADMQAFLLPVLRAREDAMVSFDPTVRPRIRTSESTRSREAPPETGTRPERP